MMDFLFLLEKACEDSPGSLRLTLGVRINGDTEAWAENHTEMTSPYRW